MNIKLEEYQLRRQQLLTKMGENSIAIIPCARVKSRSGDNHYPFRQDSDFYYLTGFNEAEAILVLCPGEDDQVILFNQKKNPEKELWTGAILGQEAALLKLGVDAAYPFECFDDHIIDLLLNKEKLYYTFGRDMRFDKKITVLMKKLHMKTRAGVSAPSAICMLSPLIANMRLYKSQDELKCIKKAVSISSAAHITAMQMVKPEMTEYEIEAIYAYEFIRQGARQSAYSAIVGAGANGCVLHYTDNQAIIADGQLVLVDAGAEYECYAADITRTFPANGTFSPAQKDIYECVLEAQMAGIMKVRPGVLWHEVQEVMVDIITQGLIDFGLLQGDKDSLIEEKAYQRFYPHSSGHWLGLDVHDAGDYQLEGSWRPFEPGMVLTVEPGLYINAADDIDEKWWNTAVRIEDDVFVRDSGAQVLSSEAPKTIDDIETLMQG